MFDAAAGDEKKAEPGVYVKEGEALTMAHEREQHAVPVRVIYNGLTKPLEVSLNARTSKVLEAALDLFGINQNRHIMALYTATGVELLDGESLKEQGVKENDLLLLRPSTVKGGRK